MLSSGVLILVVQVTFRFPGGGPPVVGAEVYLASDLSRAQYAVEVDPGARDVTLSFQKELDAVVMLRRLDGTYYLHGPFRWPAEAGTVVVDGLLRRSVEGRVTFGRAGARAAWIEAGRLSDPEWPRCATAADRWYCAGIPADAGGVIVLRHDPLLFATVTQARPSGSLHPPVRSARWAAIVTLDGEDDSLDGAQVQVLGPRRSPARRDTTRVLLARAERTSVEQLTARSYLVAGLEQRDDLLLQVAGEGLSTVRVPLSTSAVAMLPPIFVVMQRAAATTGRVVDRRGRGVEGARLIVAEVVDRRDPDGRTRSFKRQLSELESGTEGAFSLNGLAPGRYEVLALHPQAGRGTLTFDADGRPLLLRLDPGRHVTGRVLRDGVPLPGVWVDVPASHEGYLAAEDPMEVLAPAAATAADGRFQVALPPRGATELRFDDRGVVTRLPLPAAAGDAQVDLGDVLLRGSVDVRITYAGDERCRLLAAGPLGHTGMALVEARRVGPGTRLLTLPEAGRWLLELRCPGGAARAEPPMLDVPAQAASWSAFVVMAPP